MIRIVFVEDDAVVMSNMRRVLSVMRREWDMKFYSSAEDALIGLQERAFDVVVSDFDMPGMNGAEFLALVQYQFPRAVRVLMAGPDEAHLALAAAPVAHRIVAKPCDPDELSKEIQRVFELEQRLNDPDLQSMISEVGALPSPSQSVVQLNDLLGRDDATITDICEVIESNAAMTAKLLQVVNSAYFSLRSHVADVHEAVSYLGFDAVRNLCVAMEIIKTFEESPKIVQSIVDEIHERSIAVAHVARELCPNRARASEAYVAALLHDVGLMVLATRLPEKFLELRVQTMHTNLSLTEVEMEIFGAHHADIGASLLDLWGLPFEIIEAVARHHDSFDVPANRLDALHALAIADAVVSSQEAGEEAWESDALDSEYLRKLGVDEEQVMRMAMPVNSN
jgi:putative nucleotidyltransferase with HDIG domain